MSLRIIYGKSGTGKSEYCYKEIAKKIEENEKILIITPEQFSFTAEKKLMEAIKREAVLNAEVVTLSRMAYRVINEIGGATQTNLTKRGKAMLIYSILSNSKKELKFLGKTDENVDMMETAITEFKKHGIKVEQLQREIENQKGEYLKSKLNDIYTIYEKFEEQIKGKYIDETDLLTILAENVDNVEEFKGKLIYIDEFSGFTEQEYEVIKKLIKIAKQVTITICTDELHQVKNPDTDIFYSNQNTISKILELAKESNSKIEEIELKNTYRFKTKELEHLEKNLYENKYQKYDEKVENIKLFLAKNQYSEIEQVAKTISKLVREENYKYRDISIITKNIETYSSLAKAIFRKYEIPIFIDENRDLNQNIIIQYILSVLEVFTRNWSYDAVFNYIKTGFLEIEEDEIFKLEKYCIKWGIKQNKWKKEFIYGKSKEKDKAEIERLEQIRKEIVNPLIDLKDKINQNKTVENISKVIYEFLVEQKVNEKIEKKIEYLQEKGEIDLINEYSSGLQTIIDILDEIVLVFKEDKVTIDKYAQILKVGVKNSSLTKIPGTQDQVILGDVDRSRSHKVKAIFIIGLNDGVFPSIHKDEGFLNDVDREILKQKGIELAKGTIDKLYEDNFNIYKAFTTAEEKLYLLYSSADIQGKALRPSMLITKIKKIYPQIKEESDIVERKTEILNKKTTYEELIYNISMLRENDKIEDIWYEVYNYYKQDEEWKERLEQNLYGLNYTNLPEKIEKSNIEKLYGNKLTTNISELEKYRSCPFSYYLQYGLRIKPQEELKIQSLNTGTFIHEVIDEFFEITKNEDIKLEEISEEQLSEIINKIVDEKLTHAKNYVFTSTAKYRVLVMRLKRLIKRALKYIIETIINSRFEVFGTEVEFAEEAQYKPIILTLEDGKKVEIRGKIDRIDTAKTKEGKFLRIIDYKSSIKNIDLNKVYAGLQIQLLTYLDAACKEEDFMPAGVLYFNMKEQMAKSNKRLSDEEIENKIRSNFKMKGLILADVKVVKLHDKNLEKGYSKIVPAYITKDGELSEKNTSGVTKEQFEELQKYMYNIIKQISKEIFQGNIELRPYYKNKETPCKYCDYKSICNFNMGGCENKYNYIDKLSKEEIFNKIKKDNKK
ncbi:MAG: helicase-exonuclease AddAB subunit AddB [Clostridia bacterium]|nr:helicase-exonuclease AddAB subunit AddB [Clostridia bacterium]